MTHIYERYETMDTEDLLVAGIPEHDINVMRYKAFLRDHPNARRCNDDAVRYASNRLYRYYRRAMREITPEAEQWYAARNLARSIGQDPNSVPFPESPKARRERLLRMRLTADNHPDRHRKGDNSPDAVRERDKLWEDWREAKVLQRAADKARADDLARTMAATLAPTPTVTTPAQEREQALADLRLIYAKGKVPPLAERLPDGVLPLADRIVRGES